MPGKINCYTLTASTGFGRGRFFLLIKKGDQVCLIIYLSCQLTTALPR